MQVDGVNTTEGTGAAGFYYDYGSFDEIQLGGDGMDAPAATPGVQLNAVIKSGGNQLRGTCYSDYENEGRQGGMSTRGCAALGIGQGVRTLKYDDLNGDAGGPIKQDKLWFYGSIRRQNNTVTVAGFPVENPGSFGQLTSLQNATYKLSYQLTQNNRLSHYVQYGRKLMPERGGTSTRYRYTVFNQDSGSWAGNLEWNSIVSPKFIFRAAVSSFGYNWPNLPYGVNGELNDNLNHRWTDDGSGTTFTPVGIGRPQRPPPVAVQPQRHAIPGRLDGRRSLDQVRHGVGARVAGVPRRGLPRRGDAGLPQQPPLPNFTTPYRCAAQYAARDDQLQLAPRRVRQRFDSDQAAPHVSMGVRWDYYNSFYPDQEIPESRFRDFFYGGVPVQTSVGPYSLPRTPFADNNYVAPGLSGIRRYPVTARAALRRVLGREGRRQDSCSRPTGAVSTRTPATPG